MAKPTDTQLAELISQQKRSGLSIATFAKQRGIPAWRLYEGIARARKRDRGFIEVEIGRERAGEVQPLEVVFDSGIRVRVPQGFDVPALRRLVEALTTC